MTRADRVAELIKQEVSDIISRKLNDPRIGFASITSVDLGADLQNARIYVSVYGEQKQKNDTMAALASATKFIRCELARRMQLRDVPELLFKQDDSIERGAKVFEILNRLEQEKKQKTKRTKKS
jgi:ribosome-binding factor A